MARAVCNFNDRILDEFNPKGYIIIVIGRDECDVQEKTGRPPINQNPTRVLLKRRE
jgi:hypothetical protein